MKKVICINDSKWANDVACPSFSEIVTVSNTSIQKNGPAYEFKEYGARNWYSQKYFAPLSDLDETELVTEEFEEKYCVPV